jgi:hypothetical protein
VQEAKAKLDEVVTQQQVQLEECSKQLQQAKQAAGDGCTVAELQKFVATASAERDSLKQSLLAQAKVSLSAASVCLLNPINTHPGGTWSLL